MNEMTHEELMIQSAEAMLAWWQAEDGKAPVIESRDQADPDDEWRISSVPDWRSNALYYRIAKPKQVRRVPLGPEDFPAGVTHSLRRTVWKQDEHVQITFVSGECVYITNGVNCVRRIPYENLMADWQRWDHAACDWVECSKDVEE